MSRSVRVVLIAVSLVLALTVAAASGAARHPKKPLHRLRSSGALVAIPRGQPVQIAFAAALNAAAYEPSIANAITMAVDTHPAIRGFPIQIKLISAPCGDPPADVAAATSITANLQNVG